MPERSKKTASNTEINQGSILLLFGEDDAAIVRNWSFTSDTVKNVPVRVKQTLKRRKDHEPRQLATTATALKPVSGRSKLPRSA